jgi:hypothetical protein
VKATIHHGRPEIHALITTDITAVTAGALSAAALTLAAAAAAAPSGPSSVEQTVNQLKADGYTVMIKQSRRGPGATSAPSPRSVLVRPTAGRIPERPEPRTTATPP